MINLHNESPKILVIGDLIVDKYIWGSCEKISPEAPVQVVNISEENTFLGGAGNVVNNLVKLGASADILSVIGNCEISKELIDLLKNTNINTKYLIKQKNRISSKKTRIMASGQQVVRYDRESTEDIDSESQKMLIEKFKNIADDYELILLSDYGKGVLTVSVTQSIINIANTLQKKVLVDPKGLDYTKYKNAYLLTPNKKEASEATKIIIKDESTLQNAIINLKSSCNLNVSVITLSENGVAVYDDSLRIHPTTAKEVYDVTGAGDTILASLGFAIACKFKIDDAIKFSNLAAGVVVGKTGSATATLNEIIEYESSIRKSTSNLHIKSFEEIDQLVKELKSRGKKIIFTNGCFDILHSGHINYLEEAKSYGDILILGLNSDLSVRSLKGTGRPINHQDDRAYIVAALEVVDFVVIFDEDTPYNLIKLIQPDVLVKGGDYKGKRIIGADIAEELVLVKFIEGKSSSLTIEKIIKNNTDEKRN